MKDHSALLIVDVISDFEFVDGDALFKNARKAIKNIKRLKKNFLADGMPVLYVNDSDEGRIKTVDELIQHTQGSKNGREIIDEIEPENDSIILKPQRSGFFGTDLGDRLDREKIERVTVVGWTTDICVLFTAHDAFMRKLKVVVPSDCTTAVRPTHHNDALRFLKRVAEADVSAAINKKP